MAGSATHTGPAPVVTAERVWTWLAAGWSDFKRAAPYSLTYGGVFVAVGLAITAGLWKLGLSAAIPAAAAGFALLGPVLAVGLYEISRRLETGEPIRWRHIIFVKTAAPGQLAMIGFVLAFLFLAWARIAQLLFALILQNDFVPLDQFTGYVLTHREGLTLLALGTAVGGMLAFLAFAISAFSVPLLMQREIDVVTAIITSVGVVRANPRAMLLWAWIIALVIAVGAATFFIGLAVAFPVLGHATWRAYRDVIADD